MFLQIFAHHFGAVALSDRNDRHQPGFAGYAACRGRRQHFRAAAGFFLDRGLNAAEGNEVLPGDQRDDVNRSACACSAAGCKSQREPRFLGFIHDYQVDTLRHRALRGYVSGEFM